MKFEVLKKNHLKRNILVAVLVVALISSLILNFTQAKYRVTESMPLIQGTINFSPSDFNLMAVYLNKNGETISSDKVPHVGYTLNTEQSICEVNDVEDETIEIVYENGLLNFNGLGNKGTKCTAYFDLTPDDQTPTVSISTSSTDTSITVTANASDNIGIYYYYYKLDNGEEIQSEEASYTFDGLVKDSVHTVTVRVEDAVGNEASATDEVTVGLFGGGFILAGENAPTSSTTDWTNNGSGITYYYTGNPNNWVQFAGFWWRIIRINGDGSIRMIYQGTSANTTGSGTQIGTSAFNSSRNNNMYVGFKYTSGQVHGIGTNSTILGNNNSTDTTTLNGWYRANLLEEYAEYIDGNAGFCGDRTLTSGSGTGTSTTYYTPYTRMSNNIPSLACQVEDIYTTYGSENGNRALMYPIGLISMDEALLGEVKLNNDFNRGSYLFTDAAYWTLSPSYYGNGSSYVIFVGNSADISGLLSSAANNSNIGVRPVINLRADVQLTGSGTTSDPFKVVGA